MRGGVVPVSSVAAVLWDMDGTLVDTENYFIDALAVMVAAGGGRLSPADHVALVGASLDDSARVALAAGARGTTEQIVRDLVAEVRSRLIDDVPWRPGALALLADLRAADIRTGLVTMSHRPVVDAVLAHLPFSGFDVVVTGDEVTRGKPHPEAYLRAADLLGVPIDQCVVIEDSPPGVASALAAGARVLAVPCYVELPTSHRYSTWTTLAGRSVTDLQLLPGGVARSRG